MPPIIKLIVYYLVPCYQAPHCIVFVVCLIYFFYIYFYLPFWKRRSTPAITNVLSSGLPLPAPGLSSALFVSGIRGLGSGCPAKRRPGPVVLRISLQPLSRIGRFLRLGRCGLLQPTVVFGGPDRSIPIVHGKKRRGVFYFVVLKRLRSQARDADALEEEERSSRRAFACDQLDVSGGGSLSDIHGALFIPCRL